MKHLRIIVGAASLILAVSGAFFTNSATGARRITSKPYDMTLYEPINCLSFDCGTSGTVSCNEYNSVPPTLPGGTDCKTTIANVLVHE